MSNLRSTKLFSALEDLDRTTRQAFRRFIAQQHSQRPPLLDTLTQLEPCFLRADRGEQIADFATNLLGKPDTKTLNRYFSELFKLLRKFLVQQQFERDERQEEAYWTEICAEHGWEKWMPKPTSEKDLQRAGGHRTLKRAMQVAMARNEFFSGHQYHTGDTGLGDVQRSLDLYCLLQKLKYTCAEGNAAMIADEDLKPQGWLAMLLEEVQAQGKLPVVVEGYVQVWQMLWAQAKGRKAEAQKHFLALRELLQHEMEQEEAYDLHTYALNHLIRRANAGDSDPAAIYEVISGMLEKELLSENGLLSPRYYKLITNLLCQQGLLDEAEQFVEENGERLLEDTRERNRAYNRAVVAFHRGDLKKARTLLWEGSERFKDRYYDLGSRIYLCKIFFGLEAWEPLEFETESFRQRLLRLAQQGKISEGTRVQMDQLRKYTHKAALAMQLEPERRKRALVKLCKALEEEADPRPTRWLLEALKELLQ